ncbi:Ceramide glucosyltransferase [Granulibacter bethesdensis]|nr:Ceramide glucosyltransferase [Granulibacter bethesdensis]
MMLFFADTTMALAGIGMVQTVLGLGAVWKFARHARQPLPPRQDWPAVTIMKPLHGEEPLLEQALESFCQQDYPRYQLVFGVQSADDPARHVVRRLQGRFPHLDIVMVVDPTPHGENRKIANLINMYPSARHDVLVIADSDVHVTRDYLRRLVTALEQPQIGLVTTLYSGVSPQSGLIGTLGMAGISHQFLPGALVARLLGRQDCLGATMALRRETLENLGGLAVLSHHIADDAVLGHLMVGQGLRVGLADTVPATTVPETTIRALFDHELRWQRTIQSVAPVGFILSMLQFPLFWAMLSVVLSGLAGWALAVFFAFWMVRFLVSRGIDRLLKLAPATSLLLLPVRELLSMATILATFRKGEVKWRGQVVQVTRMTYRSSPAMQQATLAAQPLLKG